MSGHNSTEPLLAPQTIPLVVRMVGLPLSKFNYM